MNVKYLNLPLNLQVAEICPFLGLSEDSLPPDLQELLAKAMQKIAPLVHPIGAYADFAVEQISPESLTLSGTSLQIEGSQVMPHFVSCQRVTLLAVTLGREVAEALEELSQTKISEAVLLDATASAATENLAEHLDTLITGEIRRKGFYPTARFSPGFSDWSISWQKELLASLNGAKLGLRLTPYNLLDPVKSITAAIGWSSTPVTRNYEMPNRLKPCQGTISCPNCPLATTCQFSLATNTCQAVKNIAEYT